MTTAIYADSIRSARCRGRRCCRPIWWARQVSGKDMPFDARPVALEVQRSLIDDGEIWVVDLTTNHWATCPQADTFRAGAAR